MKDELAAAEKAKYETVWSHDIYRKHSPGEMEAQRAFNTLGMAKGQSLNDYGSGPARATKWFRDQGLHALGVDLATNAAETDVKVFHYPLWSMVGKVPGSHWGFCCDVMEHIPPEKVDRVLASIAWLSSRGVYFRIATRPDVMGPRLVGEPLHLTIEKGGWWMKKLAQHWQHINIIDDTPRDLVCTVHGRVSSTPPKSV